MNVSEYMLQMGKRAREASRVLVHASTGIKNSALQHIAESIDAHRAEIQAENQRDVDAGKEKGLDSAMLDRLALNDARMDSMIEGLRQVAQLDDPNGELTDVRMMPSGIQVGKKRAPLGVVGIIYESRPNVTIDAASLCLKSGNATILRGGSEALHSNQAIAHCISAGLEKAGLPVDAVQVVATRDREAVGELITMSDYVDVVVPRGGKSLIERISRDAKVAVIKHLDGICHVYIDALADSGKAFDIAMNSKTHRYGVCNAMETLLVHADVAETVLPTLAEAFIEKGVELRGCQRTCGLLPAAVPAADEDWDTEYLAPILSVKIVDTFEQAVAHINRHGSAHTDAIVTENYTLAQRFLVEIDSASVIINASTRFADGFEYGLGAEIGISTDKIHVRGPVGLEGLTSQKWVVFGNGHIRR